MWKSWLSVLYKVTKQYFHMVPFIVRKWELNFCVTWSSLVVHKGYRLIFKLSPLWRILENEFLNFDEKEWN